MLGCAAMNRRAFVQGTTTTTLAAALASRRADGAASAEPGKVKLGIDNFSVRAMKWKAPQLIDYAAQLKVDSLFITDLDAFESLETKALVELRKRAADQGLQLHLGSWSVCPSAKVWKPTWGTAEQHLALAIRVAKDLGSPVARVVLGRFEDREGEGGIKARIRETAKVCRSQRRRALDAGVKIAIENHAGDLQAREVIELVELAGGRSFMGVNIDPGNATWAMEDPVAHLETLAPYVVTSSMRDSQIWESEAGATVAWTAMGEGVVDWKAYFELFARHCPGVPVHIETISGVNREIPYLRQEHWRHFPEMKAADFARFVALARRGKPRPAWTPPAGDDKEKATQAFQRAELERSLKHCRGVLGLGLRS
jgi:sugar phosphate isomerase/epimerase